MNRFTPEEISKLTPKQYRWEVHHTAIIKSFLITSPFHFSIFCLIDLPLSIAPKGNTVMEYYLPSLFHSLRDLPALLLWFMYISVCTTFISFLLNNYHKYKAFRRKQEGLGYFVAFVDYTAKSRDNF